MFNLYADVDARSMTPSRNAWSYTLRSVPSSPGRSFLSFFWWGQIQLLNNFTKGFSKYFSFRKLQNHLSLMYPKAAVVRLILFCWLVLIDTERYLENWISLPPAPGSPIHRSYRTQVSSVGSTHLFSTFFLQLAEHIFTHILFF